MHLPLDVLLKDVEVPRDGTQCDGIDYAGQQLQALSLA